MMTDMWHPVSEHDVLTGIMSGALTKSHFLEVKASASNEQIAQTLASFALDGGIFVIGIAEEKDSKGKKHLVPKPVPLEGVIERIDAISRNSVEPPLALSTRTIPSGDSGSGFVVVKVDASPLAPHMAGNKYYGRSDTSNYALSDAEVLRHHERRREQIGLVARLLDDAESHDFLPAPVRKHGHIYLLAEPTIPPNLIRVQRFLEDDARLLEFVMDGQDRCRPSLASFQPTPRYATTVRQRETGVSLVNQDADGPGRTPNPNGYKEKALLDIELRESGGIRIFVGRGTDLMDSNERVVCDGIVVAYVQRLVFWTNLLSARYKYNSQWALGLRINGIQGLRSLHKVLDDWGRFDPGGTMDNDVYSYGHLATSENIRTSPEEVVESLVGRLLRVLGTTHQHLDSI